MAWSDNYAIRSMSFTLPYLDAKFSFPMLSEKLTLEEIEYRDHCYCEDYDVSVSFVRILSFVSRPSMTAALLSTAGASTARLFKL